MVKDPELLAAIREQRCLGCGATPSEAHHVTTRGAGGGDEPTNVMPLCVYCHRRWHMRGPGYMIRMHPAVRYWLQLAGRQDVFDRVNKR